MTRCLSQLFDNNVKYGYNINMNDILNEKNNGCNITPKATDTITDDLSVNLASDDILINAATEFLTRYSEAFKELAK